MSSAIQPLTEALCKSMANSSSKVTVDSKKFVQPADNSDEKVSKFRKEMKSSGKVVPTTTIVDSNSKLCLNSRGDQYDSTDEILNQFRTTQQ